MSASDPYVYPGSQVLRNELGIHDAEQLRRLEADLTYLRGLRLAATGVPGRFDLAHLQACHRALFEGIYAWAGQARTISIAKGDTLFCLPEHIHSYARDVFGRLARDRHLQALPRDAFITRLTGYVGDVNALHPFREGNGRAQRLLFGQLAGAAGYELHWQQIDAARNIAVSIASARGNERPLRDMLEQITEPVPSVRAATARALHAAYGERDRLIQEHTQLPQTSASQQDITRRVAYDAALQRAAAAIAELETANGGPLTPQQASALERRGAGRPEHGSERDGDRERRPPDSPDLES
ncbi:MAG: Fic/DOC family protein [Gammaproteobacteria bacterium]